MTVDKMALEQRRNDIRDLIMVPGEKVNIDMLMDVLGNGSFVFSPIIMVSILTLWTDDVFFTNEYLALFYTGYYLVPE